MFSRLFIYFFYALIDVRNVCCVFVNCRLPVYIIIYFKFISILLNSLLCPAFISL